MDAKARFVFGSMPEDHPNAIPFDMYTKVFDKPREQTAYKKPLCDPSRSRAACATHADAIHDADIGDDKFGCSEEFGIDNLLVGRSSQDAPTPIL